MKATFAVLFVAGLALGAASARAQSEPPVELTGTLAKARASGAVTIAHRESSIPFSYLNARKEPIGYSIELCKLLVEAMGASVGKELEVKWLPVTSATRIEAITSGKADIECGSTTNDIERRKLVSFSPTIFVSGTKLMVKRGSPIKSFRDLAGKTVVVTAGTTNEKAMQEITKRFKIAFRLVVSPDHAHSFMQVVEGKADAFATDDVLLYGLIALNVAQKDFEVIGEFLSYDPYGVMYRKGDAQMERLVNETFHALAEDGEIERQYKRWFLRKLPSGASIDLPMSPQLETLIRTMATKPD
ncbi:Glutamate/aspartate import solute-binding protein [Usitatibacter rugosus]|uniref:Glutamate/aspartate import solute-binding protein n=1 Tax=Usitatibacter rugosus TaxID=2732067 RepID=A0A6M4GY74_9PROT|nr:amino acid ABC transporter substrate-binding protein [Usitatibacter rugosus]QJR10457.1 Glutamate/aspartate import solute-binding protein [Usitatibacter rugosus]